MENLSRIAKGIFLGNGEIWNFLDYAVNRDCGGLYAYTHRNAFLNENLKKNADSASNLPRYSYGEISTPWVFYTPSLLDGSAKEVSRTIGRNIGELYKVSNQNNNLHFHYEQHLVEFEDDLREKNTKRSHSSFVKASNKSSSEDIFYSEMKPEHYVSKVNDNFNGDELQNSLLGERYKYRRNDSYSKNYTLESVGESARTFNYKQSEYIKKQLGSNRGLNPYVDINAPMYIAKEDVTKHIIVYYDIAKKANERTYFKLVGLKDFADNKWNNGANSLFAYYNYDGSSIFENLGESYVIPTKEEIDSSINNSRVTKSNYNESDKGTEYYSKVRYTFNGQTYGIYDFYNERRRLFANKNNFLIRRLPKAVDGKGAYWSYEKTYGVKLSERGEELYSVNYRHSGYTGDLKLDPQYNGGSHTTYNPDNGVRSYSFYQEAEKGNVPTELKTSVSDGSSVLLDSYSGSSRLLVKTNQLFKDAKINSLINRFHTDAKDIDSELITAADSKFGLSRGRNLLKKKYEGDATGYDNPYCRVWTAHHQYSKLKDRIRPFVDDNGEPKSLAEIQSNYGNLRTTEGKTNLDSYSVLRSDGFVRITPTHNEDGGFKKPQNYMFSIENLAWKDVTSDVNNKSLSPEQRGPNGGRIMWFPPYNLKFSENVNVNWNANTFIGRGEEIYTYTNTVRTGTLDFTLLIDHPSILNKWRGTSSEIDNKEEKERDLLRFFAGCGNINDAVEPTKPIKEEEEVKIEEPPKVDPKPTYHTKKIAYVVFFPNNFSGYDYLKKGQELDDAIAELGDYNSGATSKKSDKEYESQNIKEYNKISSGLNPSEFSIEIKQTLFAGADDIDEIHYFNDLEQIGRQITGDKIFGHSSQNCKVLSVEVKGFASSHGYVKLNKNLCDRRRTFVEKLIKEKAPYLKAEWSKKEGTIINVPDIGNMQYVNAKEAKLARAAYAIVKIQWKEDNKTGDDSLSDNITKILNGVSFSDYTNREKGGFTKAVAKATNLHVTKEVLDEEYTYDNEYLYFSEVMGDALVHKHIVDKVRFFDPAFHSITPEGFNARLTFLHQCTRQGPTNAVSSGRVKAHKRDEDGKIKELGSNDFLQFAGNLAFGRAPYCILRIGDFFNTKICIDSMSITYDNNGVQWDLNPEGVGVQPMYANVSLSFKFLGGQDLVKPIERLQNAVTANYYANTSVYSRHADTNKYYYDAFEDKTTNND